MGLRDYVRVARRHLWVCLVAIGLALAVATVITERMPKVWAAGVTFFFATPKAEPADLFPASMFSQARLATYADLFTSDTLITPLAGDPQVGLDAKTLRTEITAAAVTNTVMLQLTVEDTDAARAERIARRLVTLFPAAVTSLEAPSTVKVSVVGGPSVADKPVSPEPLNNLALSGMAGLILGAIASVVREVSDSSVRAGQALQVLVSAPLLAAVPVDPNAPSRAGPFVSDPHSPRAEALRQLRTNLQYSDLGRPVQTLAVTSAVPGEGRSATACNLALLFAEIGQRVLIVDAELRHPRLAAFLGREGSEGLSTVLAGGAGLDQVLQPWGAGLWLMTSGQRPPNPSELLSSGRMTELIEEVRRRFDIVIFDCPPLLPVTDAAVIAARTDGALLVVRARKTKSVQVTTGVRSLRAVNARLIGCVLNMVTAKSPDATPRFEGWPAEGSPAAPLPSPDVPAKKWNSMNRMSMA